MKRLLLAFLLIFMAVNSYAKEYEYFYGPTTLHRTAIATSDSWFDENNLQSTADAIELKGYNRVRVDYDITGDSKFLVKSDMLCSNDSLWVQRNNPKTITVDCWEYIDLPACKDYYFYLTEVGAGETIKVYLTPFKVTEKE